MRVRHRSSLAPILAAAILAAGFLEAPAQETAGASQLRAPTIHLALQPGDSIRLFFWRDRDLDGEYVVDETGTAVLPMTAAEARLEPQQAAKPAQPKTEAIANPP